MAKKRKKRKREETRKVSISNLYEMNGGLSCLDLVFLK